MTVVAVDDLELPVKVTDGRLEPPAKVTSSSCGLSLFWEMTTEDLRESSMTVVALVDPADASECDLDL